MKTSTSLFLVFTFLLQAIPAQALAKNRMPASYSIENDCADGSCIEETQALLESKIQEAKDKNCLPPESVKDQEVWFEETPMSFECFSLNQEIHALFKKAAVIETHFNSIEADACVNCSVPGSNQGIVADDSVQDVDKVNAELMCTEDKKKEVWEKCTKDATCLMATNASTLITGGLLDSLVKKGINGCNPNEDDCVKQFVLSFVKSVVDLFKLGWTGIKWAGGKLWDKLTGVENSSSTAQLAAAEASEDEGVFQMLKNDFGGTMAKIWEGLLGALKHYMANDLFCQEWSGAPQFSECKRPATGFGCLECKTMIKGLCATSGVIVAEVVPAFITGGIVTAVKYGASGASKLSKLIKISSATMKLVKESKLATSIAQKASTASKVIKGASVIQKAALSLRVLRAFVLRPAIRFAKSSAETFMNIASRAKTSIMMSKAGPAIVFGGKALKFTGKVLIFPIDNPMTNKAFKMGEKFSEQVFAKAGKAKILGGIAPVLTGPAGKAMGVVDDAYAEMLVLKYAKQSPDAVTAAERQYLKTLAKERPGIVAAYLETRPQAKLQTLIEELYPELDYGKFARHLHDEDVLRIENELFEAIAKMKDGPNKDRLVAELQEHMASASRGKFVVKKPSYTKEEVLANAALSDEERVSKGFLAAGIDAKKLSSATNTRLVEALKEAHNTGDGVVFEYSFKDLLQKRRILKGAGFSDQQIDTLIMGGFTGKTKPESLYPALREIAVPKIKTTTLKSMMGNNHYSKILSTTVPEQREAVARALKLFEQDGYSAAEASKTYQKFEDVFQQAQKLADNNSDAQALMAEFIRREQKAGVADKKILEKIQEALKNCNK